MKTGIRAVFSAALFLSAAYAEEQHPVTLDDLGKFHAVAGLRCSADGKWAAYTVATVDEKADKRRTAVWMTPLSGVEPLRLTPQDESAGNPAFSPDGKYVSFTAKRGKDEHNQIWLLDRRGGEATRLTDVAGDIGAYRWSPDSKRLLISMTETEPKKKEGEADKPKVLVVDGFRFKRDTEGFLTETSHTHLYIFDVADKSLTRMTAASDFDEEAAEWSPDGSKVAFFTDHAFDQAAPATQWLSVIDAQKDAKPKLLGKIPAAQRQTVLWDDSGKKIYHLVGEPDPKFSEYNQPHLASTDLDGATHVITGSIDRPVAAPVDLGGGKIGMLMASDRRDYAVQVDGSGTVTRTTDGTLTVTEQCGGSGARAVIAGSDTVLPEVHVLDGKALRPISSHNSEALAAIKWGAVEDYSARAADGNEVHGLLIKPVGYQPGRKYPMLVWIHGGPNSQDNHLLTAGGGMEMRQFFATHGFVVMAVNYRGSSGRGQDYARVIAADWGNKEVADIQASIDWAVAQGIADPDRLAVGGWSYGGILTDFMIVRNPRLKAAVSGAGEGNLFGLFGVDQYIEQYVQELGPPWRNQELYTRLSEPFFQVDRVKTPTLFMGGTSDDNVPLVGGQQMYQALKVTGVPTQLIAYPGEFHGLRRPSFVRDRLERIVAWYDRYLGGNS